MPQGERIESPRGIEFSSYSKDESGSNDIS